MRPDVAAVIAAAEAERDRLVALGWTKQDFARALLNPSREGQDPRLFIGVFPEALVYADRSREVAGDYVRLACLPYRSLRVEFEPECPADLRAEILAHASQYRVGDVLQVSACGQSVRLGGGR